MSGGCCSSPVLAEEQKWNNVLLQVVSCSLLHDLVGGRLQQTMKGLNDWGNKSWRAAPTWFMNLRLLSSKVCPFFLPKLLSQVQNFILFFSFLKSFTCATYRKLKCSFNCWIRNDAHFSPLELLSYRCNSGSTLSPSCGSPQLWLPLQGTWNWCGPGESNGFIKTKHCEVCGGCWRDTFFAQFSECQSEKVQWSTGLRVPCVIFSYFLHGPEHWNSGEKPSQEWLTDQPTSHNALWTKASGL